MTPDEFLRAYHARYPGATAAAFARGAITDGRSSYDLLADGVRPGERVLDLGCGDGYLLERMIQRGHPAELLCGIDMSTDELGAARCRPPLAGVQLLCERADELSLASGSIDRVVSHLAFMLMTDIDQVVAEIARVLRPGGRLCTVVGGGPGEGDAFELYLELFRDAYAKVETRAPRLGNPRTRDAIGLSELMGPATGFAPHIEESAHALCLDGTAEAVWESIGTTYEILAFDEAAVADLQARFLAAAENLADARGVVPCTMRMRLLTATRLRSRAALRALAA